ncbi:MAG: Fic family protein [Desulfosalsimonadaceae bacterium]|nr:Fic family protein [Desulfosalsimonadaceae bacterium]
MPKYISEKDLYPIETLLADRPAGRRIGEIEESFESQGLTLNRRTLQRRLIALEKAGRIQITGVGRATRYLPLASAEKYTEADGGISLSMAAKEVKNQVSRPLSARQPVGYHREFIGSYQPNVTWYLPATIRNHLMDKGRRISVDYTAGTYIRQILDRLLIDLSWASSRLEGNTYSLLETERLIAFGEAAPGKTPFETQMILNHKAAIEFLADTADETGFDRGTILNLHALLSDNLLGDSMASGRLRAIPVGIGKSVYEPLYVPQLIDEIFGQILDTAAAIADPVEQAFFVTVHLPYLQPFEDVNKRVSRLAANIPLIRHNLCPLSFMDVPENLYMNGLLGIYELNRIELMRDVFVWTYERSCDRYQAMRHTLGEPDTFRLRHRKALIDCVGEAIRQVGLGNADDTGEILSRLARDQVPENDREHFLTIAKEEIDSLHEGNFARYRLRPGEFKEWQKRKK